MQKRTFRDGDTMVYFFTGLIYHHVCYFIGEKGHCLYTTEASVLFCDLKLRKGETKKCKWFCYRDLNNISGNQVYFIIIVRLKYT